MTSLLPATLEKKFLELWDAYDQVNSPEAKVAKAFDKLETMLQHTQGKNPPDFDYGFNLDYGTQYTGNDTITRKLRAIIDEDTRKLAAKAKP